jgi:hypothetical protein
MEYLHRLLGSNYDNFFAKLCKHDLRDRDRNEGKASGWHDDMTKLPVPYDNRIGVVHILQKDTF